MSDFDIAVERLTAWIRDYGPTKQPVFIGDLSLVLLAAQDAKKLEAEIERLRLYERAMNSMAAQMVHPKMTGEEMAKMQLGEK